MHQFWPSTNSCVQVWIQHLCCQWLSHWSWKMPGLYTMHVGVTVYAYTTGKQHIDCASGHPYEVNQSHNCLKLANVFCIWECFLCLMWRAGICWHYILCVVSAPVWCSGWLLMLAPSEAWIQPKAVSWMSHGSLPPKHYITWKNAICIPKWK